MKKYKSIFENPIRYEGDDRTFFSGEHSEAYVSIISGFKKRNCSVIEAKPFLKTY